MLGSHLDTVRDAGNYDGMLGVITAIECVAALHATSTRLPFAIEVIGFADEEGVRFGSTLLGSRAVAGTFDTALLDKADARGHHDARRAGCVRSRSDAHRRSGARTTQVLAYAELHIEQGPVLEARSPAGRRRHRDQRRQSLRRRAHRYGGARRYRADGPAPRRARGGCRMRRSPSSASPAKCPMSSAPSVASRRCPAR